MCFHVQGNNWETQDLTDTDRVSGSIKPCHMQVLCDTTSNKEINCRTHRQPSYETNSNKNRPTTTRPAESQHHTSWYLTTNSEGATVPCSTVCIRDVRLGPTVAAQNHFHCLSYFYRLISNFLHIFESPSIIQATKSVLQAAGYDMHCGRRVRSSITCEYN